MRAITIRQPDANRTTSFVIELASSANTSSCGGPGRKTIQNTAASQPLPAGTAGGPLQAIEESLTRMWQERTEALRLAVEDEVAKAMEAGRQTIATELKKLQDSMAAAETRV